MAEVRLIDGNKSEAVLRNIADHLKEAGNTDLYPAAYAAADVIKQQPTIDPEGLRSKGRGSACSALRWSYGIDTDPEIVSTTDREKLIELLKNAPHFEQMYQTTWQEAMAGWLINNGVTFAADTNDVCKWVKADQPPEDWKGEGGYLTNYYVYTPDYGVDIGNYMGAANRWLCMGMPCNVTHWMPLPEPPKEVYD